MRIGSLKSEIQDPSQGLSAQMPPWEAVGRSADQGELDGHYLFVVTCAMLGGWPHVATSPEFSREARTLDLYMKLFDFQVSAMNQSF